jgi:hypothetical protein
MLPEKPCQNKFFKLRAVKFSGNLHKIQTDTEKKIQVAVTFRDNGIKVLRYIYLETVSHLVQHLFFKKACKTKSFCPKTVKFFHNQYKVRPYRQ